jgi:hypothetical protein
MIIHLLQYSLSREESRSKNIEVLKVFIFVCWSSIPLKSDGLDEGLLF